MSTGTPQNSSKNEWLDRKFEDGRLGVDCRYPECTDEPEPRRPGKSGPPSKFCVRHNNKRDRQFTARAEEKAERDRAAADEADEETPVREPLPQILHRRAHHLAVLAELGPRLVTAAQTIVDAQQTILDTEAVADHIAEIQQQAETAVRTTDTARAAAERATHAARTGLQFALLAAVGAVAERDAATKEAATALGEAAEADTRARAAGRALDELAAQHQELRGHHQELTGAHEQLDTQHQELTAQHRALQETYSELSGRAGRLEGELSALRPRLESLTARNESLEEQLRTGAGELATASARAEGLQEQLGAAQAERTREREEHQRALDEVRERQREETGRLRTQLAALSGPGPQHEAEAGPEPAAAEDTAAKTDERGTGEAGPADFPAPGPEPVDLGVHDGRHWVMEPEPGRTDRFRLLADEAAVGTLAPALRGSRPTGQWQAGHRRTRLAPRNGRHFADHTAAIRAVIEAENTYRPLPAADNPVWAAIPADLRTQLSSAALNVNPDRGYIAALEPAAYRRALASALRAARGHGRISPRHLTVLLDAPRADFGPPSHERAQRLHEVLQQLREHLVAGADGPKPEDAQGTEKGPQAASGR
ncbi:hypothetical protein [Streptomyces sp. NPDC058268]|uniref:hypothetical protein n=1 Tax=Streptomyces sp. NPDC058268 TaxID=3346413 RepID=UPI0036E95C90